MLKGKALLQRDTDKLEERIDRNFWNSGIQNALKTTYITGRSSNGV